MAETFKNIVSAKDFKLDMLDRSFIVTERTMENVDAASEGGTSKYKEAVKVMSSYRKNE